MVRSRRYFQNCLWMGYFCLSNLVLFLALKGSTKTDGSVTPLPYIHEYIYTSTAVGEAKEFRVSVGFVRSARFPACQGRNPGTHGLVSKSQAAPGWTLGEYVLWDFVLYCYQGPLSFSLSLSSSSSPLCTMP